MSYKITRYEDTPNPNAVKCWLDRPISDRPRSFLNARQAANDALAAALFAVEGVATLLFNGEWMTVNKKPSARWPELRRRVEQVLAAAQDVPWVAPGEAG